MTKEQKIIAKLREIIVHVGGFTENMTTVENLRLVENCKECESFADELSALESQPDKAEEKKTAEEILDSHSTDSIHGLYHYDDVIKFMVEYASQFASQSLPEISNELINDEAIKYAKIIAEEYASQERGYPKEFVRWLIEEEEIFLGELCEEYITNSQGRGKSLDELFEIWQTNIKDKQL